MIKSIWMSMICMLMAAEVSAAIVIVPSRPVIVSRPAVVSTPAVRVSSTRVSTPARSLTENPASKASIAVPIMTTLVLTSAVGNSSASTTTHEVDIATPMLTICTSEEVQKAKLWEEDCMKIEGLGVSPAYCPILSFFRYCKEATLDEVKGLKPVKENYRHVFLKD